MVVLYSCSVIFACIFFLYLCYKARHEYMTAMHSYNVCLKVVSGFRERGSTRLLNSIACTFESRCFLKSLYLDNRSMLHKLSARSVMIALLSCAG